MRRLFHEHPLPPPVRSLRDRAIGVLAAVPIVLALLPAGPASAEERVWAVRSPSGAVSARVVQDTVDGGLTLEVRRDGARVTTSRLGLTTQEADYTRGLRFDSVHRGRVRERYETAVGKRRAHQDTARHMTLAFSTSAGQGFQVQVRAFDDGVGYRYVLPGSGPVTVMSEASSFRVPASADGWLMEHRENYENQYQPVEARAAEPLAYAFPALFHVGKTWTLLTESAVDGRYAASHLRPSRRAGDFHVAFPQDAVRSRLPLATPWRVAVVGDLETVVESDLVTDLAPGKRKSVPDWVRPGKVAWSWWSDGGSPRSFERQKDYVDHASEEGWEYVLVDEGWSSAWMPELVDYAEQRGVKVIVWARWSDLETESQRKALLGRWKSWGIAGVKVDFMNSDTQQRMRWYDAVLRDTYAHELLINFHGSTVPRGIQRTWPHVMTMEGVRGAEDYHLGSITPRHNVALAYTRNVVGPMDYTPVTFSAQRRETSAAHELALSIVYESGWQHLADSVESYDSRGVAEAVLRQVPTVWEETEFVAGRPGRAATLARRSGERWYVGSNHFGAGGTSTVPLDFLEDGRRYTAEVVRDRGHDDLEVERRQVSSGDSLRIPTADNGGFVVLLCPAEQGRCLDDALLSRVSAEPGRAFLTPGSRTTVTVPVENDAEAPLTDVEASLSVPDGWAARRSSPEDIESVAPGSTVRASWVVQVPDGAEPGTRHDLRAQVSYAHGSETVERTAVKSVHIEPWKPPRGDPYLSDVPAFSSFNWVGPLERDMSNGGDQQGDGRPLTIEGRTFEKGLGGHAHSEQVFYLGGNCERLSAHVGVDDEVGDRGSVVFQVWGDGRKVFDSGRLTGHSPGVPVDVSVRDVESLRLVLTDGGDFVADDHGDWGDARLHCG